MKRLAAIDVGSTSVHLLVADVSDGALEPVLDVSTFAGLGDAVAASGVVGAAVATELARLLAGYVGEATELGAAQVVIVATAPLRRAADAARVVSGLGVPVHVLTEREEAL